MDDTSLRKHSCHSCPTYSWQGCTQSEVTVRKAKQQKEGAVVEVCTPGQEEACAGLRGANLCQYLLRMLLSHPVPTNEIYQGYCKQDHYINHSDGEMKQHISELGKRKFEDLEGPGYVYAAFSIGNGIKIRMTCRTNPIKRIRALNTGVKYPYQVVDMIRCGNPREIERFLHNKFRKCHAAEHKNELF
eukprot:2997650-Rhodomonas_salina.1